MQTGEGALHAKALKRQRVRDRARLSIRRGMSTEQVVVDVHHNAGGY